MNNYAEKQKIKEQSANNLLAFLAAQHLEQHIRAEIHPTDMSQYDYSVIYKWLRECAGMDKLEPDTYGDVDDSFK